MSQTTTPYLPPSIVESSATQAGRPTEPQPRVTGGQTKAAGMHGTLVYSIGSSDNVILDQKSPIYFYRSTLYSMLSLCEYSLELNNNALWGKIAARPIGGNIGYLKISVTSLLREENCQT